MTRYIALLRGINVGTAKRVAMPALREVATALGYTDVATHLNSGNLLLTTEETAETVQGRVEQAVEDRFGLHADVVVRTAAQLADVVRANPFPDDDPARVTIAFLAALPPPEAEQRVARLATDDEPVVFLGTEVYVHYGHGQGGSRLAATFGPAVGVSATVRNLRTTTKLVELTRG